MRCDSGLLLPRLLLPGRKLRLTGFVKGKENSQDWNELAFVRIRVILLFGVSTNVAVTIGYIKLSKYFQVFVRRIWETIGLMATYWITLAIIENDYPVYITYNIFIIYYSNFSSILFWNVISNITFVMANSYPIRNFLIDKGKEDFRKNPRRRCFDRVAISRKWKSEITKIK